MKTKIIYPLPGQHCLFLLGLLLLIVFFLNIFYQFSFPDQLTQAKRYTLSLSKGDRYFGRLQLWRYFVRRHNWPAADSLARSLDPVDTAAYLALYSPDLIKQSINRLIFKSGKTADDYIEIARSYAKLGDSGQAQAALRQAYQADPIRDDISRLYYQLSAE